MVATPHQKSAVCYQNTLYFSERSSYTHQKSPIKTKRVLPKELHFVAKSVKSIKRALHSIERADILSENLLHPSKET